MILFMRRPDRAFRTIIERALEGMRDLLAESIRWDEPVDWPDACPTSARCFSPESARDEIERLIATLRDDEVFQVTDYHWLLLYECLAYFCEVFNDADAPTRRAYLGDGELASIDFIDLETLVEVFFWDTDFLFATKSLDELGTDGRAMMGISDEAFGIAHGLAPHRDDLVLGRVQPEIVARTWEDDESGPLFDPRSPHYPAGFDE